MMPGMGGIIAASGILGFLMLILVLTLILTIIVVGKYIYIRYLAKKHCVPFKALLGKRLHNSFILLVIAYSIMAFFIILSLIGKASKQGSAPLTNFVINEDYRYGDLLFPKGSMIDRDDRKGLRSARFPEPIALIGLKISALEAYPLRLELAEDAMISPVYELQYEAESNKMIWVKDQTGKSIACQKGDVALFVDLSNAADQRLQYRKQDEDVHFVPEEWQFVKCETNYVIKVPSASNSLPTQYGYPLKSVEPLSDDAISALTDYYVALSSKDDKALSQAMIRLQALADEGQEDVRYIIEQIKHHQ